MSLADAALVYVRRGLPVFPVWPAIPFRDGKLICGCGRIDCEDKAKHPLGGLVRNGVRDATTDADRVRHWWRMRPDANIGVACTGMVVLDVDPRHAGDVSLIALEEQHDVLPDTWTARSGSGGRHLYFTAPTDGEIKNSSSLLAAGLDIRAGAGGYVLAQPSRHISGGCYQWVIDPDEVALAPLPVWLRDALIRPPVTPPEEWRELVRVGPGDGSRARQAAIARLAGHLVRRYVDPLVVLDLLQCWNATRCDLPLTADEVTATINSIAARELRRRGLA